MWCVWCVTRDGAAFWTGQWADMREARRWAHEVIFAPDSPVAAVRVDPV